jgi:hypothetical protein
MESVTKLLESYQIDQTVYTEDKIDVIYISDSASNSDLEIDIKKYVRNTKRRKSNHK